MPFRIVGCPCVNPNSWTVIRLTDEFDACRFESRFQGFHIRLVTAWHAILCFNPFNGSDTDATLVSKSLNAPSESMTGGPKLCANNR